MNRFIDEQKQSLKGFWLVQHQIFWKQTTETRKLFGTYQSKFHCWYKWLLWYMYQCIHHEYHLEMSAWIYVLYVLICYRYWEEWNISLIEFSCLLLIFESSCFWRIYWFVSTIETWKRWRRVVQSGFLHSKSLILNLSFPCPLLLTQRKLCDYKSNDRGESIKSWTHFVTGSSFGDLKCFISCPTIYKRMKFLTFNFISFRTVKLQIWTSKDGFLINDFNYSLIKSSIN